MEDTMGYLLGLAGLIIGYMLGKMTGATNRSVSVGGDQMNRSSSVSVGGDNLTGSGNKVGGNQANDKSKQNN